MTAPDITIPPEALEAGKNAWYANQHKGTHDRVAATCLAMLRAWPGMKKHKVQVPDDESDDIRYKLKLVGLILPLPQEPRHD